MGVINPYSQPELEDKGWEFKSDDVTVKPDDGSVTMQSLDEELTALAQACKALTDEGYVFAVEGEGTTPLPVADYNRYWFRAEQANNNQHALLRLSLQEAGSGTVETKELLSMLDRVGTDSIQNNAVTRDKIADNAVTVGKIANNAVLYENIDNFAVKENSIAPNAVTSQKIAANAVTQGKIGANAVATDNIENGAVTNEKLSDGSITEIKIDETYSQKIANAVEVTYSALKDMRDNGKLVAGQYYRITDFVTTSAQAETRSAGHAFDIVVVALDSHTLSETANAVQHNGDTYYDGCNLEAWELKYCIDNDTTRFAWADEVNGKGVIYYMKDEFNNECPYDFKNIQFKLYAGTGSGWDAYLSSCGASATTIVPYRLTLAFNGAKVGKYLWYINANDYTYAYTYSGYNDDKTTADKTLRGEVHDCQIGNNWATVQKDDTETYKVLSLNFIVAIPFLLSEKDDTFNVYSNDLGINCHDVVLSNNCFSNKLGDNCYNIHASFNCYAWSCGDGCHSWSCANGCYSWSCGNDCYYWTCGNGCSSWSCGNNCSSWTCGNNSSAWSCGDLCYSWRCGDFCSFWNCGNGCYSWACGNSCSFWTCGNRCSFWACGNICSAWSCGNDCRYWTIGTKSSMQRDYTSNFHLANGVSYLYIYSTSAPTSATPLQNFVIKSGVKGDDSNKLEIIIDNAKFPLNADYEWTIAKNSKGEVVQYCEADLIQ